MHRRASLHFPARCGIALYAWEFVRNLQAPPLPAVTVARGDADTKYYSRQPAPAAIAEAGVVVLLHDHRRFGDSGSDSRRDIGFRQHIADSRRALSSPPGPREVDAQRVGP